MTPELIAAIIAILGALGALIKAYTDNIKIKNERAQTAQKRDNDSLELHDMIQRHEFEITRLKDEHVLYDTVLNDLRTEMSVLNKNIATLTVKVEMLVNVWDRSSNKSLK